MIFRSVGYEWPLQDFCIGEGNKVVGKQFFVVFRQVVTALVAEDFILRNFFDRVPLELYFRWRIDGTALQN